MTVPARTLFGALRRDLRARQFALVGIALTFLATAPLALAQSQVGVPEKGHGSISIAYQSLYIYYHLLADGERLDAGTINTNTVFMNFDYGLSDRWAINVGLPYRSSKYDGTRGHNPGMLHDDHGESFIDDGQYHSNYQDWNLSLRYQWRSQPWLVTPYLLLGYPSNSYPTFAHSAVGTGQWRAVLGLNSARQFNAPLQNMYFNGGYSYSFMEPVDRRVNHSTLTLELGYFVTPRVTTRLQVVAQKTHHGFDFPEDFPNRNDDHFFHHDENLRNDFVNVGAGVDYRLNDHYQLFANYGHTVWGENSHLLKYVVTAGVTRSF